MITKEVVLIKLTQQFETSSVKTKRKSILFRPY